MLNDHVEDSAPLSSEATQPVARRLVSDDGVNWRPYNWLECEGRSARFERVEVVNEA